MKGYEEQIRRLYTVQQFPDKRVAAPRLTPFPTPDDDPSTDAGVLGVGVGEWERRPLRLFKRISRVQGLTVKRMYGCSSA